MAKIEVFPLVVNEQMLVDQATFEKVGTAIYNAVTSAARLEPMLAKLRNPKDVMKNIHEWTDQNTADLVNTVWPFMRMPEAEARAIIQAAEFQDQIQALGAAFPLAEQAWQDSLALGRSHGGAQNN